MTTDLFLGLKRRDMEEVRSVVTTDSQGSKTLSPRGLEGQNGRSLDTESQDSEKSYTFRRCTGTCGQEGVISTTGSSIRWNLILGQTLKIP